MSTQSIVYQVGARLTCKIDKFSSLTEKFYSDTFCAGGYKWRILIFPKGKGNSVKCLSLYLCVANSESLPYGWNIPTVFSLSVIDQNNSDGSVKEEPKHEFNARESNFGVPSFMSLVELHKSDGGYLVNDQCIIEADLRILNSSKSVGEGSSQHNMAKINIGGEDIELSKAEIKKRAKVVTSNLPAKASEALRVYPDVSLNVDPKLGLTSSMSSSGLLMQAIVRQETMMDIILNMKDENCQLKTDLEVCQHQLNNVEAEVSRLKKEAEQSAKKLVEIQEVKKSSIDAKLEGLEEALTEEKKTIEGVTSVELKERCLNMYSAGYMACEKDMKRILEETGFNGLLTGSDNEASSELTQTMAFWVGFPWRRVKLYFSMIKSRFNSNHDDGVSA